MIRPGKIAVRHASVWIMIGVISVIFPGCVFTPDPTNAIEAVSTPVVQFIAGGFWELTLDPNDCMAGTQLIPTPFDGMIQRATTSAIKSLDASRCRLWIEVNNQNNVNLHYYDLRTDTGKWTTLADIFMDVFVPPPGDPGAPPGFDHAWRTQPFRIEREGSAIRALVFQQQPKFATVLDFSLAIQPTYRVVEYSLDHIRMTIELSLELVATRDYPWIPPLDTADMQRGECFPAKILVSGTLRRTLPPRQLGFAEPERCEGGIELILPMSQLLEAAIAGDSDEAD